MMVSHINHASLTRSCQMRRQSATFVDPRQFLKLTSLHSMGSKQGVRQGPS